jgi:hypothetical protein
MSMARKRRYLGVERGSGCGLRVRDGVTGSPPARGGRGASERLSCIFHNSTITQMLHFYILPQARVLSLES